MNFDHYLQTLDLSAPEEAEARKAHAHGRIYYIVRRGDQQRVTDSLKDAIQHACLWIAEGFEPDIVLVDPKLHPENAPIAVRRICLEARRYANV